MKKAVLIGAICLGVGICIPLLAGMVSKSISVDGHIEHVSCSNGITSVITAINQNTKRIYNYDISGNMLSTLTVTGSN